MYPAKIESRIEESEARETVGNELIDEVMAINCEFTNRVIDDCYEAQEMSSTAENEKYRVDIYYLVSNKDIENSDGDMGNCDYSDYSFDIYDLS